MSRELNHEAFRDIAPELALGIAVGEERADALRHAARCSECRSYLDSLTEVADGLLLLVPDREPSVGFESRVLQAFDNPRRRSWMGRHAVAVAAALVASVVAAGLMLVVTSEDRSTAASYRETLAIANGEYFSAAHLMAADGTRSGLVYIYQGDPSWVFVYVDAGADESRYTVELLTEAGDTIDIGYIEPSAGSGSWGRTTPVDVRDVTSLRLLEAGRVAFNARLH